MSFRDFQFPGVVDKFGLTWGEDAVFPGLKPVAPSAEFLTTLKAGHELAHGINTEKARSEFVVAPLLLEVRRLSPRKFGIHSGVELDVDPARGLTGACKFLIARDPLVYRMTAPLLAVVEVNNESLRAGFGPCIATMLAAQQYNLGPVCLCRRFTGRLRPQASGSGFGYGAQSLRSTSGSTSSPTPGHSSRRSSGPSPMGWTVCQ